MEIRSNSLATSVSRTLTGLNMQVARSIQRLSNGTRINSFADDIGGAAIADSMRAQIRGIHQSIRNSQDATAMVSTAEGGLHEIHQLITRIRDLVVDAANDTHTLETRQMFQLEINQLMDEINNISARTQYNSMDLLSGSLGLPHHPTLTLPITNRLPSYYSAASLHVHQMWQTDPPANAQLINFTGAPNASSFGENWQFVNGVLHITGNGAFHIRGTGQESLNNIVVNAGVIASIILDNVNIYAQAGPALDARGATVDLHLRGRNVLASAADGYAGIQTSPVNSSVSIRGPGILEATGGIGAAGIGGGVGYDAGLIDIFSGTIIATGRGGGAGIGGGLDGFGGDINIRGGTITATGSEGGAGIGGGRYGSGGHITFVAGIVEATGGLLAGMGGGAGIGGGFQGDSGSIHLGGGRVTATGVGGGAGIGGGHLGHASGFNNNITILSGITRAEGGVFSAPGVASIRGAAIGGGGMGLGADLLMRGGLVELLGDQWIGGGQGQQNTGSTRIQGGNLSMNPDNIRNPITHYVENHGHRPAFQVQISLLDMDRIPINFTPETHVSFTINGVRFNSIVDSRGNLFAYLPLEFTGSEIVMNFNGENFFGEPSMRGDHVNPLVLRPAPPTFTPIPEMPGVMLHFQTGANSDNSMFLYIPTINARTLMLQDGLHKPQINVVRQAGFAITSQLGILDHALSRTMGEIARMGAAQSRLDHIVQQLSVTEENLSDAESRIRNADMAMEMLSKVRAQVQQQAAINMLSQAISLPERILPLLEFSNALE